MRNSTNNPKNIQQLGSDILQHVFNVIDKKQSFDINAMILDVQNNPLIKACPKKLQQQFGNLFFLGHKLQKLEQNLELIEAQLQEENIDTKLKESFQKQYIKDQKDKAKTIQELELNMHRFHNILMKHLETVKQNAPPNLKEQIETIQAQQQTLWQSVQSGINSARNSAANLGNYIASASLKLVASWATSIGLLLYSTGKMAANTFKSGVKNLCNVFAANNPKPAVPRQPQFIGYSQDYPVTPTPEINNQEQQAQSYYDYDDHDQGDQFDYDTAPIPMHAPKPTNSTNRFPGFGGDETEQELNNPSIPGFGGDIKEQAKELKKYRDIIGTRDLFDSDDDNEDPFDQLLAQLPAKPNQVVGGDFDIFPITTNNNIGSLDSLFGDHPNENEVDFDSLFDDVPIQRQNSGFPWDDNTPIQRQKSGFPWEVPEKPNDAITTAFKKTQGQERRSSDLTVDTTQEQEKDKKGKPPSSTPW